MKELEILCLAVTGMHSYPLSFPGPLASFALGGATLKNMSVCREHVMGAERELQYVLPTHSQGANLSCISFSLLVITDFKLKSRHFELFVTVYV